jgi:putative ABC transport system ATP-binding protein
LNDQGITILVITHEHDIARYAKRVIRLRDGRLVQDEPVRDRRNARRDLAGWRDPEDDTPPARVEPAVHGGAA